jgi:hypothetical protein
VRGTGAMPATVGAGRALGADTWGKPGAWGSAGNATSPEAVSVWTPEAIGQC